MHIRFSTNAGYTLNNSSHDLCVTCGVVACVSLYHCEVKKSHRTKNSELLTSLDLWKLVEYSDILEAVFALPSLLR